MWGFGRSGHHRWRRARATTTQDDLLALAVELALAVPLLIAIPHSFLADIWLLPSVAPFLPLAMVIGKVVVRMRRRPAPPPQHNSP